MKRINVVDMNVKSSNDSSSYHQYISECIEKLSDKHDFINIIKIHFANNVKILEVSSTISHINDALRNMNASNCLLVPILYGQIEDITVDSIEVRHINDDSRADKIID